MMRELEERKRNGSGDGGDSGSEAAACAKRRSSAGALDVRALARVGQAVEAAQLREHRPFAGRLRTPAAARRQERSSRRQKRSA